MALRVVRSTCETALRAAILGTVSTPQYIGPYEVVRPLGMGGMAETFEGIRRGLAGFEQRVCIKRVLPVFASEPRFVDMFLDEARLLAQLRNARITQVYDFGEADGTYYMAIELVEGTDLEGLLRSLAREGRQFPVDVLVYVLAELLSALSYAHGLEVNGQPLALVHRDISPSNVLVSQHGEVKLTDFGIAQSRQRSHRTKTGHTRGKLAYMSPEQLRGDELDGRSDLFAVGVVAYELLTGRHPFDTDTDLGLIQNIVSATRIPLTELAPSVPPRLVALVDALLVVKPEERPANAEQALALLPFEQAPHVAQRALATLVQRHQQSAAAARAQQARPAGGAPSPEDTVAAPRPYVATPPAAVHASRTDALSAAPARGATSARTRAAVVSAVVLGAGGLALVAALSHEPAAREAGASLPATSVAPPAPAPAAPVARADTPELAVSAEAPVAVPADAHALAPTGSAAPASVAPPVDAGAQLLDALRGETTDAPRADPVSAERRQRPVITPRPRRAPQAQKPTTAGAVGAPPPPPPPADAKAGAEPQPQRGRSGLSVRTDDF
jgi:eukaryotic-like serine/threonine-protein kinase